MRLIDADKIKPEDFYDRVNTDECMEVINEQPTVYDIDAVVRKLEQCKYLEGPYLCEWEEAYNICIEDAIDIVRRGVRNDD